MKYLAAFLSLLYFASSYAQLPEYYVDMVKGNITIQHNNKTTALKYRDFVYKNDVISINNNADEVTLVNKDAFYIVLGKTGSYPVTEIIKQFKQPTAGITKKYLMLIWEQIKNPSEDTKFKADNILGVERSACGIETYPLDGLVTAADTVIFKWSSSVSSTNYAFTLTDNDLNVVLKQPVSDTFIVLNKENLLKKNQHVFYWKVQNVTAPCDEEEIHKIVWLSKEEYAAQRDQLISAIQKTDDINHYYLEIAKKLFSNGFFELSSEYLQKAVTARHSAP